MNRQDPPGNDYGYYTVDKRAGRKGSTIVEEDESNSSQLDITQSPALPENPYKSHQALPNALGFSDKVKEEIMQSKRQVLPGNDQNRLKKGTVVKIQASKSFDPDTYEKSRTASPEYGDYE